MGSAMINIPVAVIYNIIVAISIVWIKMARMSESLKNSVKDMNLDTVSINTPHKFYIKSGF